jgi:MinD-like ATPase involved in chromosome partitioning or flagellar assembly
MIPKVQVFATSELRAQQIDQYRNAMGSENMGIQVTVVAVDHLHDRLLETLDSANQSLYVLAFEPNEFDAVLVLPLSRLGKGAILISDGDSTSMLRRARDSGALDYVPVALLDSDFMTIIRRMGRQPGVSSIAIGFTGVGGGAGASTVAAVFAEHCARKLGQFVALVDFDITFGRQGVDFGITTKTGFAANYNKNTASDSSLEGLYTSVETNLDVFSSPHVIDLEEVTPLVDGSRFLNNLRQRYDIIVFDVPTRLSNFEPELLAYLDILNVVFVDDLQGMRNLTNVLKWLENSGTVPFHPVLNKRTPKAKLTIDELKDLLKLQNLTVIEAITGISENQSRIDVQHYSVPKIPSSVRHALDELAQFNGLSNSERQNGASRFSGLVKKVLHRGT